MNWVIIGKELYSAIYKQFNEILVPFGTFSDVDGNGYHFSSGIPTMMMEWGIDGADEPIIKNIQTIKNGEKEWTYEFFMNIADNQIKHIEED